MYCCERQGRKVQAFKEMKNTWNFQVLLSSRLQHRVLVHFFQVLLTWLNRYLILISALCNESKKSLLKWYPVPACLLSFDIARCSWQVQCACTITARLSPCSLWPFSFSFSLIEKYRCENGWSTTPRFISFPLRAFWSMILWRKRPERKDEVREFPVWNVHEAHGRSTAVGRNAPSRTQTIILQVIYFNSG